MFLRIPIELRTHGEKYQEYGRGGSFARAANGSNQLDRARLSRGLGYVEEHLLENITVTDLAIAACLSIFNFTRPAPWACLPIATSADGGWRTRRR